MRQTGYDDLIWNRCSIYDHGRQSVMDCVSSEQTDEGPNSLVCLTVNLHRIDTRNSPKQAKNEIIQKIIL